MAENTQENIDHAQSQATISSVASTGAPFARYIPKSKAPFSLNTLVPTNMAYEVNLALNKVIKKHGNIDNYVRDHLKYPSLEALWKALAAEQIDSLTLYLNQFDSESAIIIADQTGIGKGRQAAAIIRHTILNGYLPVFVTKSPNLFTDMYRDLTAIGFTTIHPFILNTDSNSKVKDQQGNVVFSPLAPTEQIELIASQVSVASDSEEAFKWFAKQGRLPPSVDKQPTVTITSEINYLPEKYNVIFTTYSQIQSAHPAKRNWLQLLVETGIEGSKNHPRVVFIMDESHLAGGYDTILGNWFRSILPQVKACCYLSATFAKYPEVMPLYAQKTSIREAGLKDDQLVAAMSKGGLALQEIAATNLAESGQLIRRQRSQEGINTYYITLDKEPQKSIHHKSVDQITEIMREIVEFETEFLSPTLESKHRRLKAEGKRLNIPNKNLGVRKSPYFSRVFNIIDQMLFALKVSEVAKKTIDLLNQDKKVVIAFKSTMGAFLDDLSAQNGDQIPYEELDFARALTKGLESTLRYNVTDLTGNKTKETLELNSLGQAAVETYNNIKRKILSTNTGLIVSPIDQLIDLIESSIKSSVLGGHNGQHFKVAEVTGRKQRLELSKDYATARSYRVNVEEAFRKFNLGEYDVLLINQSGSTGASAHASKEFKDQRQRAMIIHQFELDINLEVQKRGRINRTGQVVLPEYYYITSSIPMEKRLMNMLKSKLKSLDANTTGSQKTSETTLESPDFMNKYGDKVAWTWVNENPYLTEKLGRPTYHKKPGENEGEIEYERNQTKDGAIRQVTGRLGLLAVHLQQSIYDELLGKYNQVVKQAKDDGSYDLEVEFLPLEAEVKKRFVFIPNTGGNSPFGREAIREVSIVNNLRRPLRKNEVDKLVINYLDGRKPDQAQSQFVVQVSQAYSTIKSERVKSREKTIEKLNSELKTLQKPGPKSDQQTIDRYNNTKEQLEELVKEKTQSKNQLESSIDNTRESIIKNVKLFKSGDLVRVPTHFGGGQSWGIFMDITQTTGNNPFAPSSITFRFAVTDERRILQLTLAEEQLPFLAQIALTSQDITPEQMQDIPQEWNEIVKESSMAREKRIIYTNNIIAAAQKQIHKGKLIKYNLNNGEIKSGILLNRSRESDEDTSKSIYPLVDAKNIIKNLHESEVFSDMDRIVMLSKTSDGHFKISVVKSGGRDIYLDNQLRQQLIRPVEQPLDELPEFVQSANQMVAEFHRDRLTVVLEILSAHNLKYLGESRELEDFEKENIEEWEQATQVKSKHTYQLARPYGQNSNPQGGFLSYQEPTPDFPHGTVTYSRRLTEKERYNYSLVPVFKSAEEAFVVWKEAMKEDPVINELKSIIENAKDGPHYQWFGKIGQTILFNPHEKGNRDLIFGNFTEYDLGRAAFEHFNGKLPPLKEQEEKLSVVINPNAE